MAKFFNQAPTMPITCTITTSYDNFVMLIGRLRFSAPGPDGVPYACWQKAGGDAVRVLFAIYNDMLGGRLPPPSFLSSILVFIHKEWLDGEVDNICRGPA